jgi:hypothetical protein
MVRGMRSMGSAALVRPNQVDRLRCSSFRADTSSSSSPQIRPLQNFCAVAAGQLDLYSEIGCWEWDVCAGTVIATEAGGVLFGGKERDLDRPLDAELIASTLLRLRSGSSSRVARRGARHTWSYLTLLIAR